MSVTEQPSDVGFLCLASMAVHSLGKRLTSGCAGSDTCPGQASLAAISPVPAARLRHAAGGVPKLRLNARLKAASDS